MDAASIAGPKDHAIMYTIGNREIIAKIISTATRMEFLMYNFFLFFKCLEYNPDAIMFVLS